MDGSVVRSIIEQCLARAKSRIEERLNAEGYNATAESLDYEASENGGTLYGAQQIAFLENGRGAGKVPFNFQSIIREWIIAKGIPVKPIVSVRPSVISAEERGLRSASAAIAHTIMTKGTRLHREGRKRLLYSDILNEEIEKLRTEIDDSILMEVRAIYKEEKMVSKKSL